MHATSNFCCQRRAGWDDGTQYSFGRVANASTTSTKLVLHVELGGQDQCDGSLLAVHEDTALAAILQSGLEPISLH